MDKSIFLKQDRQKAALRRHPWVFSGAIDEKKLPKNLKNGELVSLKSADGNFIARGFYSKNSQIRVRLISFDEKEVINQEFFLKRLKTACSLRDPLVNSGCDGIRLVSSEGDLLPGLIVDKYNDIIVISITSTAMEQNKSCITQALKTLYPDCLIYERSDSPSRSKEGLKPVTGPVDGSAADLKNIVYVREYEEILLPVDIKNGHKTGAYLDQRASRRYLKNLCRDKSVLNCFCYTGGFGLWALKGGASKVVNVDTSDHALKIAQEGVIVNHLDPGRCKFLKEDVFSFLRDSHKEGLQYDVIILDPPKFADSSANLKKACRGYQDINRLAFLLLKEGGSLLSFSCSGLISLSLFQKIVSDAALEAGVDGRIIKVLMQDCDHVVSLACPETSYLKGLHIVKAGRF